MFQVPAIWFPYSSAAVSPSCNSSLKFLKYLSHILDYLDVLKAGIADLDGMWSADPEILFFTSVLSDCKRIWHLCERLNYIKLFLMLLNFFLFSPSSRSPSLFHLPMHKKIVRSSNQFNNYFEPYLYCFLTCMTVPLFREWNMQLPSR